MKYFVERNSVVRKIWGNPDTILFIFAGASAEFALNKAVDWLYFTGKLPKDPIGRLFSTVAYARQIIFAPHTDAINAIDKITAIHKGVEQSRGSQIPDWAYRDVLFMLIDYSIRSFEVLERELNQTEKKEIFDVFNRLGLRMDLQGLPDNYTQWLELRKQHLLNDLTYSHLTKDLNQQYLKSLGYFRYQILIQVQLLLIPQMVKELLPLKGHCWIQPVLYLYKFAGVLNLKSIMRNILLPKKYSNEINDLG